MPCEELHLRSLIETSERLNGREFIRSAQKNDIDDELRKNITLFLPTDATFTEFAEQLLESVCLLFEFASFFVASVYFASISNVLTFVPEFGCFTWIKISPTNGSLWHHNQIDHHEPHCARYNQY